MCGFHDFTQNIWGFINTDNFISDFQKDKYSNDYSSYDSEDPKYIDETNNAEPHPIDISKL
jgi:hypothetical protein